MDEEKITDLATEVILLCRQQGLRIATAESLTGDCCAERSPRCPAHPSP